MRLSFFSVPVAGGGGEAEAELNRFLSSHRVLAVDRQLVQAGSGSVWAVCVSHIAGGGAAGSAASKPGRVDYRDLLPNEEFALFARLRSLRKQLADGEGIPAYAIFTNEQLAAMVRARAKSVSDLNAIAGVGRAKIEKYAAAFLDILRAWPGGPSTGGEPQSAELEPGGA